MCVCFHAFLYVYFTGTLQLRKGNNLFGLQRAVNRESSRHSKKGKEQYAEKRLAFIGARHTGKVKWQKC